MYGAGVQKNKQVGSCVHLLPPGTMSQETGLPELAQAGKTSLVESRLKSSAVDVDARDKRGTGMTALHHSAARGDSQMVRRHVHCC